MRKRTVKIEDEPDSGESAPAPEFVLPTLVAWYRVAATVPLRLRVKHM